MSCEQDQITSFIYKTLVEDDLYFAQNEDIFKIILEPEISENGNLVELEKLSETGGPYGIVDSHNCYICKVSSKFNLTINATNNGVELVWPRFLKKWEKTSDGLDIHKGLITCNSILSFKSKSDVPPQLIVV